MKLSFNNWNEFDDSRLQRIVHIKVKYVDISKNGVAVGGEERYKKNRALFIDS